MMSRFIQAMSGRRITLSVTRIDDVQIGEGLAGNLARHIRRSPGLDLEGCPPPGRRHASSSA